MDIACNYSKKCISCLDDSVLMHNLKEMFDDSLDLGSMLKMCLYCEIDKPYFPSMLCDNCLSLLKDFYNFKMQFLRNEIILINNFRIKKDSNQLDNNKLITGKSQIEANPLISTMDDTESEEEIILKVIDDNIEDEIDTLHFKASPTDSEDEIDISDKITKLGEEFPRDEAHISIEPTKFKCSVCKRYFIDSASLNAHTFKHKNHKCDICSQAFIKKSYLADHMATHKSIRDISCPLCPKAFKSRHTMRAHMKIHTNPGEYVCENCGCSFNHIGTLKTHLMLKHSQERDYLCLWCGMKFKLKATLDKHTIRKHSLRKSRETFKCLDCNREYLNKSTLDRHCKMKHSSSYKLVACELCHKYFSDKSNLLRHKRIKHAEELIELNTIKEEGI